MLAGRKLKALRSARGLTGRQVEQASRRIAAAMGDKRFCISNGWLIQLENGDSEPSICKIFSLCAIYKLNFLELIRIYGIKIEEIETYELVANPHSTQLLSTEIEEVESPRSSLRDRPTTLVPETIRPVPQTTCKHFNEEKSPQISLGYIGLNDMTMYPMIRPGSLVRIDISQNKIQPGGRPSVFERPIYFVELRNGYTCGWCELQGNELLIVPHHSSPARIRRFTYTRDAEIVGRVISFDTRCVDEHPDESEISDSRRRLRISRVG